MDWIFGETPHQPARQGTLELVEANKRHDPDTQPLALYDRHDHYYG
jgi:hypothetical protein